MTSVALVAIAKNEDLQVQDFLNQYKKLGVSAIQLQDNASTDAEHNLARFALEEPSFRVHIEAWTDNSARKQPNAQNHFLRHFSKMQSHVIVVDLDEIIVLKKHATITELCIEHCASGALGLNWFLQGDSGLASQDARPQQERFSKRQIAVNPHVKQIAKCSDVRSLEVHHPVLLRGTFHDTRGKPIVAMGMNHNPGGPTDVAVINHQFTKTLEEFLLKKARGRATTNAKRSIDDFHRHNFNEVEDLSAWTFFTS